MQQSEFSQAAVLDARVYALQGGMPVLCYGPTGRNVHGCDEAVSLPSLRRITGSIALIIATWCSVETADGRPAGS